MAKTVLIVDDSKLTLEMVAFMVTGGGYRTLTARSGLEAMEIMAGDSIDLVMIDINMPGMDGYTLIRRIREDTVFGDVALVILTTEKESGDQKKGYDAGADAYLIKPVMADEVVAQIRLLIGNA